MAKTSADLLRLMRLCGLHGPSWAAWRVILRGFVGDTLDGDDLTRWRDLTGRRGPAGPAREFWAICGRRAGKSIIAALIAVYVATCRTSGWRPAKWARCWSWRRTGDKPSWCGATSAGCCARIRPWPH